METEKRIIEQGQLKREKSRKEKRNRSKKQSKVKQLVQKESVSKPKNTLLPEPEKKPFHSNLPQLPVKRVTEPLEVCKICGEVIDVIASAMTHPQGGFCHFDCVVNQIAAEQPLAENQKVSYIGRGTFAVVEQKEDGTFTFQRRIIWENAETFEQMKKFVEAAKQ